MKLSLSVTALLTCTAWAENQPAWLQEALNEREPTLQAFAETRRHVDSAIINLVDEIPAPIEGADTTMPEGEPGETVAVADGGMLFDVAKARMVYINNVRVSDPRLRLRCADRLYIQLPAGTLKEGEESAKDAVKPGAQLKKEKQPQQDSDIAEQAIQGAPIDVDVATAMVNAVQNKALLIGTTGTEYSIRIEQGDTHMYLTGTADTPAQALVDTNGDLLITAAAMDVQWRDAKGNLNTLTNRGGMAYYRAESARLLLTGESQLTTAEASIACTEEICVTLKQEERKVDEDKSIMPQFGRFRIVGINGASARGNVRAQRVATGNTPDASISGEELVYDATTGECSISGSGTALHFGKNKITTNGSIQLAGNGDITLQGDSIDGTYARPTEAGQETEIAGTFHTGGKIQFTAEDGIVRMPQGIRIQDELCDFKVGGAIEFKLCKASDAASREYKEAGEINLAIASYSDIETICATGGISLRYLQGEEKKEFILTADDAEIDMVQGSALLTAAGCAKVSYADFSLTAESASGSTALQLSPEGNLSMQGEKLTAVFPTNEGPATVHCTDALTLVRETGRFELGAGAHVEAPQGRLTANGPLYITLRKGPEEKARPLIPQFPHLVYNFDGLQQADTEQGGTVQTPQAAMRCTGKIHVAMSPATGKKSPLAGVELATAEGNVAVTGKDNSGRVLTAYGDKLSIDGQTGEKRLSGKKVILQDSHNTHTASGTNAAVILDKNNNVRITGSKQSTSASNIQGQIEKQQKSKK